MNARRNPKQTKQHARIILFDQVLIFQIVGIGIIFIIAASSSTGFRLPPNDVFHQKTSFTKGCLPVDAVKFYSGGCLLISTSTNFNKMYHHMVAKIPLNTKNFTIIHSSPKSTNLGKKKTIFLRSWGFLDRLLDEIFISRNNDQHLNEICVFIKTLERQI